jgi:hypothetical protein
MPARPCVTQIVPMEFTELRRFAGAEPLRLRRLLDGAAAVREHPARVLPELPLYSAIAASDSGTRSRFPFAWSAWIHARRCPRSPCDHSRS